MKILHYTLNLISFDITNRKKLSFPTSLYCFLISIFPLFWSPPKQEKKEGFLV